MGQGGIEYKKTDLTIRSEVMLAYLLRIGATLSAFIIALGIGLSWFIPNSSGLDQASLERLTHGTYLDQAGAGQSLHEIIDGILNLNPASVITLGLLSLIALPIIRVGSTVVLFVIEKDYLFVLITLMVFMILIGSITLGKMI